MKSSLYRTLPTELGDEKQFCITEAVLQGLSGITKWLPSWMFYDQEGSRLYEKITRQPEYYPTGVERKILKDNCRLIGGLMPHHFNLVELGAGDGHKTFPILDYLLGGGRDFTYVPIDICEAAVDGLTKRCSEKFPELAISGLVGDNFQCLYEIENDKPRLILFLGSSIGNYDEGGDKEHLRRLYASMKPGDKILIGYDSVKSEKILVPAYSDAAGLTADFNFNLLVRINRELGGAFDPATFRHEARFNQQKSRMESWLISEHRQDVWVAVLERSFHFESGEGIHTENSVKYTPKRIAELAQLTGFTVEHLLFDDKGWFCNAVFCR